MEQDLYNFHIDKKGYLCKEKKYPRIIYINMRLPIDKKMNLWAKYFEKAFKILDKKSEYNTVILLKADNCTTNEKSIMIQGLKKMLYIDK